MSGITATPKYKDGFIHEGEITIIVHCITTDYDHHGAFVRHDEVLSSIVKVEWRKFYSQVQ